jgi:predicted ATP-grasp superfamily ATP-dependent carboligase
LHDIARGLHSTNKPSALVGFPREVSGLAVIRSLQQHGIRVSAYDCDPGSAGLFMQGLDHRHVWPCPDGNESQFVESLLHVGDTQHPPVLIDLESMALEAISRHQSAVQRRFRVVLPPLEVLDIAQDKAKTAQFFTEHNLGVPITAPVSTEQDIVRWQGGYPAVLKPRRGKGGRGQRVVRSVKEAQESWRILEPRPSEYLIQEWISGPVQNLCTVGLLCAPGGEVRALFSAQRLGVVQTSKIPEGPSSIVRSIRLPDLLDMACRFARLAGWVGFAELEFKKDERDGVYKILEINPRMWAWIRLPITCGVDFPYLYYTMATTGDCPSVSSFTEDVIYLRSILHLYTQAYQLRSGKAGVLRCILDTFRPYADIFRPKRRVILEDLGLRQEYLRWFMFYFREAVR